MSFKGNESERLEPKTVLTGSATKPFDDTFSYFEIESCAANDSANGNVTWYAIRANRTSAIGIGLCNSSQLFSLPGMVPNSYGLHSEDGKAVRCLGPNEQTSIKVLFLTSI